MSGFISTCIYLFIFATILRSLNIPVFLSDKNRAPYFISEEIDIMRTGYATYYTLVPFDYRRLQNRTLQLDFFFDFLWTLWLFGHVTSGISIRYLSTRINTSKKWNLSLPTKKTEKNIYKTTETVVFIIIVIIIISSSSSIF